VVRLELLAAEHTAWLGEFLVSDRWPFRAGTVDRDLVTERLRHGYYDRPGRVTFLVTDGGTASTSTAACRSQNRREHVRSRTSKSGRCAQPLSAGSPLPYRQRVSSAMAVAPRSGQPSMMGRASCAVTELATVPVSGAGVARNPGPRIDPIDRWLRAYARRQPGVGRGAHGRPLRQRADG
jgi:hypothetical protein